VIRAALSDLTNALRDPGAVDESACRVDATFAAANCGDDEIGPPRRGNGINGTAIVDRQLRS
jgi:hypothetical protein